MKPYPIRNEAEIARIPKSEEGYVLLIAIFFLAILVLSLAVAAPQMAKSIQRDRELETFHRGRQYRRAIQLYYRKFHTYPPNIDALVKTNNIRFLRKRYIDPITGKDDWKPIMFGRTRRQRRWDSSARHSRVRNYHRRNRTKRRQYPAGIQWWRQRLRRKLYSGESARREFVWRKLFRGSSLAEVHRAEVPSSVLTDNGMASDAFIRRFCSVRTTGIPVSSLHHGIFRPRIHREVAPVGFERLRPNFRGRRHHWI